VAAKQPLQPVPDRSAHRLALRRSVTSSAGTQYVDRYGQMATIM